MRKVEKRSYVAVWSLPPTNSEVAEQLELGLFAGVPWEGRSPRVLTRGSMGLILKPEAAKARATFVDPDQIEMFPRRKAPRRYNPPVGRSSGAFSLLLLPRR